MVHVGPEATRGYRGLLLYLAGVWLHLGAKDETERARARELVREAGLAANRGTWLREMLPLSAGGEVEVAPMDLVAVNEIVARLRGRVRRGVITAELAEMQAALAQDEAARYERGLTILGKRLGASASKPKGQARCDSAWEWGTALWVTIEAKFEEREDGLLPAKDIRQANTQLDQLAHDRGADHAPAGSVVVLLSERLAVDPEHASGANPYVYLTPPDVVSAIVGDVTAVWKNLLTAATGRMSETEQRKHVRAVLSDSECLPSQVVDRLTQTRIRIRPGD